MDKKIFISHSSKNSEIASQLCDFLESNGKKCFIAPRDIRVGMEYAEEIVNGIDNSETMVLILSRDSNESVHVLREVERAVSKKLPIIVYRIEEVELSKSLEYFLMTNQWMDAKKMADYKNILICIEQILSEGERKVTPLSPDNSIGKPGVSHKKLGIVAGVLAAVIILLVIIIVKLPKISESEDMKDGEEIMYAENQGKDEEGEDNSKPVSVKVADTVTFGTYYGEPIEWRVVKVSDDGKEAFLITKNIICMKAYDVAEGGKYNRDEKKSYYEPGTEADTNQEFQIFLRGNCDWSKSNIRTWLNSDKEVVKYNDQAPIDAAGEEGKNGYNTEPGFLYNFTKDEIAAIVDTENVTPGNKISGKKEIKTTDKVFLISMEQLKWLDEAGISRYTAPTQAATVNDESPGYAVALQSYPVKEYQWWLRDPVDGWSSRGYLVQNGYSKEEFLIRNVGLESFGIRPAVTVDIQSLGKVMK